MEKNADYFEALYERHALEIKKFIFTISRRDPVLTEDLFQATWMNAWRGLESLKDEDAARAWIYAIARNESKRHFYNNQKSFLLFEADDEEEMADEEASYFPDALSDVDLVSRLVSGLEEREQQLILLHYAYDISLKDIAGLYGANYNTVKSTMRRSLAKLKKMAESAGGN